MRALRAVALLMTVTLAGAACGSGDPPPERVRPAATRAGSPAPGAAPVAYTVRGMAGFYVAEPFRIDVKAVERGPGVTVLRMEITNTGGGDARGHFGAGGSPSDFSAFRLLDPVGRKIYHTLRENDWNGLAFGTRHTLAGTGFPEDFAPGVRYPAEVYFPPLPPEARAVTVAPGMGFPPITGVPVKDGGAAPVARPRGTAEPKAGEAFQWPVVPPSGKVWSWAADLTELVETPRKTTTQEGATETVGLRTDVLFAFDKATLSPEAAAVLDEVAEETRRRADPARPPIRIVGHTDDKGGDSYNLALSLRRAQAVRGHLAARLGTEYRYSPEGKGETAPIAANRRPDGSDNPEGRARNRRVDVSYTIRRHGAGTTTTEPAVTGRIRGSTLGPARFRATPGAPVASFDWAPVRERELRVDVLPFYRDGAYLVACFDVTNKYGDGFSLAQPQPFAKGSHDFSNGASLRAFTLLDPATRARYHPVKAGGSFVENVVGALDPGETTRAYVYFPAPPDDRTSIDLDVAGLGRRTIPIVR
ncbi:OmpA family protein [Bailinhaonella thermotolerans]|nr:OmpA family protein [Bailinhaonella thermotolerans]